MTQDEAILTCRDALITCRDKAEAIGYRPISDAASLALDATEEFDGCGAIHFVRKGEGAWEEVDGDKVDYYRKLGYVERVLYLSRRAAKANKLDPHLTLVR